MNFNKIKDLLFRRGGLSKALIQAMHTTESYKLVKDELDYMRCSRNMLRDELLSVYKFLEDRDMFEIYLDERDCVL